MPGSQRAAKLLFALGLYCEPVVGLEVYKHYHPTDFVTCGRIASHSAFVLRRSRARARMGSDLEEPGVRRIPHILESNFVD